MSTDDSVVGGLVVERNIGPPLRASNTAGMKMIADNDRVGISSDRRNVALAVSTAFDEPSRPGYGLILVRVAAD